MICNINEFIPFIYKIIFLIDVTNKPFHLQYWLVCSKKLIQHHTAKTDTSDSDITPLTCGSPHGDPRAQWISLLSVLEKIPVYRSVVISEGRSDAIRCWQFLLALQEVNYKTHKASKVLILGNMKMLFTTGTSRWNDRQIALWDQVRASIYQIHLEKP